MFADRITRPTGAAPLAWLCGAVLALLPAGPAAGQEGDHGVEWPREITRPEGEIVIYQPQLETFDENDLTARAAVSIKPSGADEPIFGAIWLAARVSTDRENRTVTLRELDVTDAKFPHAAPEQIDQLSGIVEGEFGGSEVTISLDRILTMLELVKKRHTAATELEHDPPDIVFVDHPAMLVTIDGSPNLQPAGDAGVMRVVNTPFFIAIDPESGAYFMTDGTTWLSAPKVDGPWQAASGVPAAVKSAAAGAFRVVAERPAAPGSRASRARSRRPTPSTTPRFRRRRSSIASGRRSTSNTTASRSSSRSRAPTWRTR